MRECQTHYPKYPLVLDEKFADGAAYLYGSSEYIKTELTSVLRAVLLRFYQLFVPPVSDRNLGEEPLRRS